MKKGPYLTAERLLARAKCYEEAAGRAYALEGPPAMREEAVRLGHLLLEQADHWRGMAAGRARLAAARAVPKPLESDDAKTGAEPPTK